MRSVVGKKQTGSDIAGLLRGNMERKPEPDAPTIPAEPVTVPEGIEAQADEPEAGEGKDTGTTEGEGDGQVDNGGKGDLDSSAELQSFAQSFFKSPGKMLAAYVDEELFSTAAAYPKGRPTFIREAIEKFHKQQEEVIKASLEVKLRYEAIGGLSLTGRIPNKLNEELEKTYQPLIDSTLFPGLTRSKYASGCVLLYAKEKGFLS